MTSPRRSRGALTASQASAPAQVIVLESPWIERAATSVVGALGNGKGEARKSEKDQAGDHGALRA